MNGRSKIFLLMKKLLQAEIKALKARAYRARKRQHDPMSLSESFKWILLFCYVLSSCSVACAQSFWIYKRKLKKLPPLDEPEMTRYLEDLFIATPLDEIWAVAESTQRKHMYARKSAYRWHAKWQLRRWVKAKNVAKGMAVPRRLLAHQYNRIAEDIPFVLKPKAQGDPRDDKCCRVFLHRWRFALQSKWGRISVQEVVALEEKQKKVAPQNVEITVLYVLWNRFSTKSGTKIVTP